MTAPVAARTLVFVPAGRPVLRFVAVLAGIGAFFAALWWSGLVAARVDVTVANDFARRENAGVAVVTVRNEGPLAARAGPVDLAPNPDDRYFEPPVRLLGEDAGRATRIEPGGEARFTVRYVVDCTEAQAHWAGAAELPYRTPALRLRVPVEGALGTGRSVTPPESSLAGACDEPVEPAE